MQPPAPIQTLNGSEKDHLLPPTGRKVALREEDKHPYAEYGTGAVGLDQDGVRARKPLDDGAERRKKAGAWQSLDVYQSLANVARHPSLAHEGYYDHRSCLTIFWRMMESSMVLVATGLLTGLITLAVNLIISYFSPMGLMIAGALRQHAVIAGVVFSLYVVVLSLCSVVVTNNICPEAVGGGIPDVKTVLSGLISRPVLSVRLIVAKMLGLVFALVAGLSVGKEGPFVHVAVAVSDSLMRLRCFRHCRRNISKRLEILGCASAAGVAATFGTPFGGVLFSIEVTATCYMVRNLPRAFLTAVCASLVYNMVGRDVFALFKETGDRILDYSSADLLLSVLLGVLCGLAGAVYVGSIQTLCLLRNRLLHFSLGPDRIARRRVELVLVATVIIAPVLFLDMLYGLHGMGDKPLTDYLFSSDPIGLTLPLFLYVPFKFLATVICVSLPLPVGLFTPTFTTGGAMGRVFGEVVNGYWPNLFMASTFDAAEFAIIGAAAFSAGVTRAISTAIIVFELTGQHHLHMPMSIAILAAYFVANRFTKNVYDVILDTNGTPILPELPAELYMISAAQVMKPMEEVPCLTLDSTFGDAEDIIVRCSEPLIPVVDSTKHMGLQGAVLLEDLKNVVSRIHQLLEDGTLPLALLVPPADHPPHMGGTATPTGPPSPRNHTDDTSGSSSSDTNGGATGTPLVSVRSQKQVQFHPPSSSVGQLQQQLVGRGASPAPPPALRPSPSGSPSNRRSSPRPPRAPLQPGPRNIVLNFVVLKDRDLAVSLTPKPRSRFHGGSVDVIMDSSPYQIADSMILSKVDLCFRMLKLSQAYVVKSGRLVGVLTRDRLTDFLGGREKRPMDRCLQLLNSCASCLCCREGFTPRRPRYEPVPYHKWPSDDGVTHQQPPPRPNIMEGRSTMGAASSNV